MTHATPTTNGRSSGQFTSPRADLEEEVVDYQAELDELIAKQSRLARQETDAIALDAADDRRRFFKYRAVEWAIRHGDRAAQLAAFHSLVTHVEADELREDERRVGRESALQLLAIKTTELRSIFRSDFVPRILAAFVGTGRS